MTDDMKPMVSDADWAALWEEGAYDARVLEKEAYKAVGEIALLVVELDKLLVELGELKSELEAA